jgi:methylated-DNA-[protein]-cysteine S-methyltransferase
MPVNFIKINTPFGIMGLEEENGALSRVCLPNRLPALPENTSEFLENAKTQFEEYFGGGRRVFDLPLDFGRCADFSLRVYAELMRVEYGGTASYKDIAERVGSPKAYRAVGMANNRNPLPVIVPCHRIIGSGGKLVGYGGGLELKERLLLLESAH